MARRKPKYYQKDKKNEDGPARLKNSVSARGSNQKVYIKSIFHNDIVFCDGPAGSGKTHIAVGCAVQSLIEGKVERIVITRPTVEAGESIGYLPGTADQKLTPYLLPVFDELKYFVSQEQIFSWKNKGILEVAPIGLMRGRSFHNAFIIGDECQNLSMEQTKMFLTRMGFESKLVITGDRSQSDLPFSRQGAFTTCLEKLKDVSGIGIIHLKKCDIVRNPLIPLILECLDEIGD